jgi:hypothetical protein
VLPEVFTGEYANGDLVVLDDDEGEWGGVFGFGSLKIWVGA